MKLLVGTSGFYNSQWKGIFYPENLASKNWFQYYCEHFRTFEINATFYSFPTLKTMQNWFAKSPDDFVYAVKAHRMITHYRKWQNCETEIQQFYSVCREGLRHKLGWILFQMPPSFAYSDEKLHAITSQLDQSLQNAIEFRHASWWKPEVFSELEKHNAIFCTPSYPNLPEQLVVSNGNAYVRLHGRPKLFYSAYADAELDNLLSQAEQAETTVVFFNNTASQAGIETHCG